MGFFKCTITKTRTLFKKVNKENLVVKQRYIGKMFRT